MPATQRTFTLKAIRAKNTVKTRLGCRDKYLMSTFSKAEILHHMNEGNIEMEGYVPWGSNYSFVVNVSLNGQDMQAVYKPRRGERPLWDFPTGTLCLRERAAYLISEYLSWQLVPPTLLRDGPQGWGSIQFFIDHDPNENYFTFKDDHAEQLQRVALFDIVINNADRKGGHVIVDDHHQVWAIDHGIAFHDETKLRTVIWDYAGQQIPAADLEQLADLEEKLTADDALCSQMRDLLSQREIRALKRRINRVCQQGVFPEPGPGRPYPWPLV